MTIQQPVPAPYAAPPQLPPPVGAYPVASPQDLAVPVVPVQEQTPDGLQVRWDGTVLAPRSVMNAVYLMWAGAVLAIGTGILGMLGAESAVEDFLESTALVVDPGLTGAMVTGVKVASIAWAAVEVLLWMWLASANGKGKGWARVVATVFYACFALGLLGRALAAFTGGLLELIAVLPAFAVGTAALILLWVPSSSRYVAAVRGRRR